MQQAVCSSISLHFPPLPTSTQNTTQGRGIITQQRGRTEASGRKSGHYLKQEGKSSSRRRRRRRGRRRRGRRRREEEGKRDAKQAGMTHTCPYQTENVCGKPPSYPASQDTLAQVEDATAWMLTGACGLVPARDDGKWGAGKHVIIAGSHRSCGPPCGVICHAHVLFIRSVTRWCIRKLIASKMESH